MTALSEHLVGWAPTPLVQTSALDPEPANRLAHTLDLFEVREAGDELPITWHWIHFTDWPATADLGDDGHPADGHFLPPIPHRRRMFAGSSIETVGGGLRLGEPTRKRSEIVRIEDKTGRSGAMLFVTVRSEYRQDGELRLIEDQDIVYRSDPGTGARLTRDQTPLAESTAPWSATPTPTSTTLFRYSALTGNAHRIHYDLPYATQVEGYPDLVVHGPLLATYLADLARHRSGRRVEHFAFRLRRPIFLGDEFRVEAAPTGDDVSGRIVTGDGVEHVTATGRLTTPAG